MGGEKCRVENRKKSAKKVVRVKAPEGISTIWCIEIERDARKRNYVVWFHNKWEEKSSERGGLSCWPEWTWGKPRNNNDKSIFHYSCCPSAWTDMRSKQKSLIFPFSSVSQFWRKIHWFLFHFVWSNQRHHHQETILVTTAAWDVS